MGFSQLGDVHFLKGVPGWSWTPFLIDFGGSGEALGDHLRPPLGDFGRPWGHFGRRGGSLWLTLGALESLPGDSGATLGSLGGDFGVRGLMYVTFVQNVQILSRNLYIVLYMGRAE